MVGPKWTSSSEREIGITEELLRARADLNKKAVVDDNEEGRSRRRRRAVKKKKKNGDQKGKIDEDASEENVKSKNKKGEEKGKIKMTK